MIENYLKDLRILYVEDEPLTREVMTYKISEINDNLLVAKNGNEALKIFSENKIDLLITDLEMPKLSGLELIKEIRQKNYTLPIIVFTAYTNKEYLMPCANLNIQGYIEKPIDFEKLQSAFQNVLTYLNQRVNEKEKLGENIYYDTNNFCIEKNTITVSLNKKERLLLELLLKNKNQVVSYKNIETEIWYYDDKVMTIDALKNLIKNLRKKTSKELIENISGLGYKLVVKN